MNVQWHLSPKEIEQESFRQIEEEASGHGLSPAQWRVARRMIHASTDFSIIQQLCFAHDPISAGLQALRDHAPLYSDSNMIRAGISVAKLKRFSPKYEKNDIHCHIADPNVARQAEKTGTTRALASLDLAKPVLDGGIILIGNAPLALAGLCRMIEAGEVRPRLVIAMPVGFVNVLESKEMIAATPVPHIVLKGRRGGSPLAVAALHGLMESGFKEA